MWPARARYPARQMLHTGVGHDAVALLACVTRDAGERAMRSVQGEAGLAVIEAVGA